MTVLSEAYCNSPLGSLKISATENEILSISYSNDETNDFHSYNRLIDLCISELKLYFEGKLRTFSFPVCINGTHFQNTVWNELLNIAFGETISYGELSRRIKNPAAIRAVGTANGANRLNIVVPCHRVIGANGRLVGYGGGLWRKKWLLDHEKSVRYGTSSLFGNF